MYLKDKLRETATCPPFVMHSRSDMPNDKITIYKMKNILASHRTLTIVEQTTTRTRLEA